MERRDLYEDDLTEERQPTPAQRDDVARSEVLDPDILPREHGPLDDVDDDQEEVEEELDD